MTVHIADFGNVVMRTGSTDLRVLRQIFHYQEYDFSGFRQHAGVQARYEAIWRTGMTPIIIDAGANIGAAAIWFAVKYPRARVLAVEPDPTNAERCRANCARLENVAVLEAAVGACRGLADLVNESGQSWSVRTQRSDAGRVKIRTIADLTRSVPSSMLFIVKIDIEGFEADLFSANTDWLNDVCVILIEPHDWMLPGQRSSQPFQRAVAAHDFDIVVKGENLICFQARIASPAG